MNINNLKIINKNQHFIIKLFILKNFYDIFYFLYCFFYYLNIKYIKTLHY